MSRERNHKIWKDIHLRRIVYFFLSISFILFIVYYNKYKEAKQNEIILSFLIAGYFIFILFNTIRIKLTYLSTQGISIGNAPNDKYDSFKFLKKTEFIPWNNVDSIKIFRREIHRPLHDVLINYIVIKTKSNKKYECFIAQPKSFVKALKSLNKGHLLSKDSKYLDLNKN